MRLHSRVFIIAIFVLLSLSGCGNPLTSSPEINNLQVKINETFSGTLREWKQQDIVLEWEITSPPEKESYALEIQFGQSIKRWKGSSESLEPFKFTYFLSKIAKFGTAGTVTGDGNRRVLKIRSMNLATKDLIPLGLLSDHQPGEKVVFNITLNDENPEKSSEVKGQVVWERPKLTSVSQAPVLKYEAEYTDSTEPCISVYDIGVFSFNSRPLRAVTYVNGKLDENYNGETFRDVILRDASTLKTDNSLGVFVGVTCDKSAGRSYSYVVNYENEIGNSVSGKVSFRSVKPGKSQADVDAANESSLIGSCTGKIKITENSASAGDCGYMKVEVFQSDLDTGSCKFLGNWTDRNGTSRIGVFEYCGAFRAGSFKEDYYYTLYVNVVGPTTYTTRLGTDRSVLEFSVLTDK